MATGSHIAAFFDIDGTLIEVNSGSQWLKYQWQTKQINFWSTIRSLWWLAQYRMSMLNFDAMAQKALAQYTDKPTTPIVFEIDQWVNREIESAICAQAYERVEYHRRHGHTLVILSSATRFISEPIAKKLGIEHILCTELQQEDGIFTGKHCAPACYGDGKVLYAERFANEHDIDLKESYFYTDSYSDMPMLMRVGRPRVVNPDSRLRRKAKELGWAFENWSATATV